MFSKIVSAICVASLSFTFPAYAQDDDHPHFYYSGDTFDITGIGEINGVECEAHIEGVVGTPHHTSGPHADHSNHVIATIWNEGDGLCPFVEFEVKLYANGAMKLNGNSVIDNACFGSTQPPVPYSAGSVIISPSTSVSADIWYGICNLKLNASGNPPAYHS